MSERKVVNIVITAHIDHGKSTLVDRLLEKADAVHQLSEQHMDSMSLEREKGITIKKHVVSLNFDGITFNIIDTPGHADFATEVHISITCADVVCILVDVTQGVQAQTVAYAKVVKSMKKPCICALNKVDVITDKQRLQTAEFDLRKLMDYQDEIINISAKSGYGVDNLLKKIASFAVHYKDDELESKFEAVVIDSYFLHVPILIIKILNGSMKTGDKFRIFQGSTTTSSKYYKVSKIFKSTPKHVTINFAGQGDIVYVVTNIPQDEEAVRAIISNKDSIQNFSLDAKCDAVIVRQVFPKESANFINLEKAIRKLAMNDNGVIISPTSSNLGRGFKIECNGELHSEVFIERLTREYEIEIIATASDVVYRVQEINNKKTTLRNFDIEKDRNQVSRLEILAPMSLVSVRVPTIHFNKLYGFLSNLPYFNLVSCEEIDEGEEHVIKFHILYKTCIDGLIGDIKSVTVGYGIAIIEEIVYQKANVVLMDLLINNVVISQLSKLVIKEMAEKECQTAAKNLADNIIKNDGRQSYTITINAAINGRKIVREVIKPYRKDVTLKCQGGRDISRKKKLLKKQIAGKKRMKERANIGISTKVLVGMSNVIST